MRIVFMGTPEFAVPALEAIVAAGHEVAGVICQPDRPKGRGRHVEMPPVKQAAMRLELPVYQFERLRKQAGLDALRALAPEVCVTAAFGQILSQKLLDVPRLGTINLHASLLPAYRGPAPAQWAIINGERQTGVTTMRTDIGIDTGDVILQHAVPIANDDTSQTLLARLAIDGAALMTKTLADWPHLPTHPQDEALATHLPMLEKKDGLLDFTQSARAIDCRARGVTPWPGACCLIGGEVYKVAQLRKVACDAAEPGRILAADAKQGLVIACADGALDIGMLQAPAGKMMPARDYLRGHELKAQRVDQP